MLLEDGVHVGAGSFATLWTDSGSALGTLQLVFTAISAGCATAAAASQGDRIGATQDQQVQPDNGIAEEQQGWLFRNCHFFLYSRYVCAQLVITEVR